jgi:phosphatidylglycerol:prolipoprotein diacylglycerol transferase
LLIAFPLLFAYTRLAGLHFRRMLDMFALPVVLWLVILRVGCFMAGCCWGDLTQAQAGLAGVANPRLIEQVLTLHWLTGDWIRTAVSYPAGSLAFEQQQILGLLEPGAVSSLPVHATQLYELALLLVLLGLLVVYETRPREPGRVAIVTLAGYCMLRFLVEYLRADSALVVGSHTFTQIICAVLLVLAVLYTSGFVLQLRTTT